jgi:chromosome segregation ATPase
MLADLMTLERQLEEADCVSIEKDEQRYDLERQVAELEESEHRWRQEYKDAEQQIHALCDRVEELTKRLADVEGDNEILQQWDD